MEDEDMLDDTVSPEMDALLANYPELAGKAPADVYPSLMARYLGAVESERAARQKAAASQAARFEAARADIEQRRFGAPTTSQQLYALSAALLSPRRQPGIAGTLGNVVPALSQMSQLQSNAEAQRAEALAKLNQETAIAREQALLSGAEGDRKSYGELLRFYGPLAKPSTASSATYASDQGGFLPKPGVGGNQPMPKMDAYGNYVIEHQQQLTYLPPNSRVVLPNGDPTKPKYTPARPTR